MCFGFGFRDYDFFEGQTCLSWGQRHTSSWSTNLGVSENRGPLFWGPYNRGPNIPYFRKLPFIAYPVDKSGGRPGESERRRHDTLKS